MTPLAGAEATGTAEFAGLQSVRGQSPDPQRAELRGTWIPVSSVSGASANLLQVPADCRCSGARREIAIAHDLHAPRVSPISRACRPSGPRRTLPRTRGI